MVSVDGVRFMGDLLWRAAVPNLVDADTLQWQQTLQRLDGGETYVPGHGGVANAQDLRDFAGYLQRLREIVREAGSDSERALAQLQLQYGSWAYFKGLAAANVRDAQAEREGRKRVPAPADAAPLNPAAPTPATQRR